MADFRAGRHTNATFKSNILSPYENSKTHIKYNDGQNSEPINTNKVVRQGCGL